MQYRELAQTLRVLRATREWAKFAEMATTMTDRWEANVVGENVMNMTIEEMAKTRIKWTSMIYGVQQVFKQMDDLILELQDVEKKEEDDARRNQE